jgi:hypothetical protein
VADQPGASDVPGRVEDRGGVVVESGVRILDRQIEGVTAMTEPSQLGLQALPAPGSAEASMDEDDFAHDRGRSVIVGFGE